MLTSILVDAFNSNIYSFVAVTFKAFYLNAACGIALVSLPMWILFAPDAISGRVAAVFTGKRGGIAYGVVIAAAIACFMVGKTGRLQLEQMNDRQIRMLAGQVVRISYPGMSGYGTFTPEGELMSEDNSDTGGRCITRRYLSANYYKDEYSNLYKIEYGKRTRTDTRVNRKEDAPDITTYKFDRRGRLILRTKHFGNKTVQTIECFYAGDDEFLPVKEVVGYDGEEESYITTMNYRYDEIDKQGNWTKCTIDMLSEPDEPQTVRMKRKIEYHVDYWAPKKEE
jgi:hypothetical protein